MDTVRHKKILEFIRTPGFTKRALETDRGWTTASGMSSPVAPGVTPTGARGTWNAPTAGGVWRTIKPTVKRLAFNRYTGAAAAAMALPYLVGMGSYAMDRSKYGLPKGVRAGMDSKFRNYHEWRLKRNAYRRGYGTAGAIVGGGGAYVGSKLLGNLAGGMGYSRVGKVLRSGKFAIPAAAIAALVGWTSGKNKGSRYHKFANPFADPTAMKIHQQDVDRSQRFMYKPVEEHLTDIPRRMVGSRRLIDI